MAAIDPKSHIGEIHGIYQIVDVLDEKDKYNHWIYKGICSKCGHEKFSHYGSFSGPKSMTTVCTHIGINGKYIEQIQWKNQKIRIIFNGMKSRCYNQNDKSYRWYGDKGIKICDEWMNNPKSFEDWALLNGYADGLTIDRINEDKNYCPENCRWVTYSDNTKYKSTTSLIDVDGEIHSGKDWARILGLGINIINRYVRTYGLDNTIEFIKRFMNNPKLELKKGKSYYELYMNNNTMSI